MGVCVSVGTLLGDCDGIWVGGNPEVTREGKVKVPAYVTSNNPLYSIFEYSVGGGCEYFDIYLYLSIYIYLYIYIM